MLDYLQAAPAEASSEVLAVGWAGARRSVEHHTGDDSQAELLESKGVVLAGYLVQRRAHHPQVRADTRVTKLPS